MLSDVAQTFADDADDGALDERLELPFSAGLLEVDRDATLSA